MVSVASDESSGTRSDVKVATGRVRNEITIDGCGGEGRVKCCSYIFSAISTRLRLNWVFGLSGRPVAKPPISQSSINRVAPDASRFSLSIIDETPLKMATRARQSTAQPTPTRPAASQVRQSATSNTALPEYEPPEFSLNPVAQRALAQLTRTHDGSKLNESLDEAHACLTEAASEINDIVYDKNQSLERIREKRRQEGAEDGEDGSLGELEQKLEDVSNKVKGMTDRLEQRVRKIIDAKHEIQHMGDAVKATAEDARNNASTQASTLNTRSQRMRRRRNGEDGDGEGSDDEELPEFEPTDPAAGTAPVNAPLDVFSKQLDEMKTRYQSFSYTARYGEDNDYITFKRAVHDAQYQNDEVPLPPNTEWFNEDGTVAALGVTGGRDTQAGAEDDSDDDIAVSRATISTKCSLSLMEFVDPVTSKKCPHSFEKKYILEFIGKSTLRPPQPNGRAGERAVQCPVGGCSQLLTKNDLHVDRALIRKIKRLQKAKELELEDDDQDDAAADGTQRRAHHIIDDDDDEEDATNIDGMDIDEPSAMLKQEPRPTGASSARPSGPPRPSQAIDLLDDDDDEEDENLYD